MNAKCVKTYSLLLLFCLLTYGVPPRRAFGQATTVREATKAAEEHVSKLLRETRAASQKEAVTASEAAWKAAAAAMSAVESAESANALVNASDTQLSTMQTAGAVAACATPS